MPAPVEVAARAVASQTTSNPALISEIESFLGIGTTDSITAAVPVVAESAAVTVEVASESAAAISLWPVVLILLLILVTLRLLEGIIVYPFGLIPLAGGRVQSAVRQLFRWLDNFENVIIYYVVRTVERMFRAALTLFTFMLGITLPQVMPRPTTTTSHTTGYATEAEVAQLRTDINHLNQVIGSMQWITAGTTTTVGVPKTLWDQVHHLEGQMHAVQTTLNDVYQRLDRMNNAVTSVEHQVNNLSGEVHAVRAISAGWQDIEQQIEGLTTLTAQFIDEAAADLDKLSTVQKQMAPLALLLEPGIKGLRNLRKLEDNICQCPKFAHIPNELGTALAVLEFVENG